VKRVAAFVLGAALVASCADEPPASNSSDVIDSRSTSIQLDRMGHVEVGPLIIANMPVADRFNQEQPFSLGVAAEARRQYQAALQKGLLKFDHYDSYPLELGDLRLDALQRLRDAREREQPAAELLDWISEDGQPHPLLEIYTTDALYVDVSKPCGDGGYLEPELATLAGRDYETCGGRLPNEDVIDRMATVLINGPVPREIPSDVKGETYPDRGDSVEEPYVPASDTFPYLAAPYDGWDDGFL
jgi:hypothetical protein